MMLKGYIKIHPQGVSDVYINFLETNPLAVALFP